MPDLNRDSREDAEKAIKSFLPDLASRQQFINFLCEAIELADVIDMDNWNLNLDRKGKFLRFNAGHQYCIQLDRNELLIVCDRFAVEKIPDFKELPISFIGHTRHRIVESLNIENVPDLLVKTKNSIGCILKHIHIRRNIYKFRSSNRDFIKAAMNTRHPQKRQAHSKGTVDYVFSQFGKDDEPTLPDISEIWSAEAAGLDAAKKFSQQKRLELLKCAVKRPIELNVKKRVFLRNPIVIAEVLFRANGRCEHCGKPAPFLKRIDHTPYLEVHHIVRLADGGNDTVENAVALCPNCHRMAHHG